MYSFGSFLLQDMFSSLQVFLLRTKIWSRLLWVCCYLHSKLWRRARLLLELFASIVERFLSRVAYLPSDPTLFYWHVVALLRESYTFVQRNAHVFLAVTDRAYVWSSMCRFLSPLIVLVPQDLDSTLYAQVCWLCCVLYMPYFGLVQMMVNKIDRPNTTPTVRAICKLAVYFSVFRPFSRFSLVYEGHWRYCIIRRKLEPLDCTMADLKRSKLCVISAVIFSLVWHLCYLPCVSVLFWLISIARYVF